MDKYQDEHRLEEILKLGAELNNIKDLDLLLEKILTEAREMVHADAGTIYIKQGDCLLFNHTQNDTLLKKLPKGKKLPFKAFHVPVNKKSISGYVAETGQILNIADMYHISSDQPFKFDPSYDERTNYKTVSTLTVPLISNQDEIMGVLQVINALDKSGNITTFRGDDEPFILHFSNTASNVLERAKLTRAILLRMISMAELRDPKETGAHVNRVAAFAIELYEKWAHHKKIPKGEMEHFKDILRMAAMLHDVGKVAISDLILKKPARFSEEEYNIMKTHTFKGAMLFKDSQSQFDEIAFQTALTHHENWDGTGYPGYINIETGKPLNPDSKGNPQPMKGKDIPLAGRLVAIADVYDALSSNRVYKNAWTRDDVHNEIRKLNGKKFDPDLVDVFFESIDILESIQSKYPDKD
ncbi:MAG: HD domain-containing protein [Spirochaetales bacterium]|nr:HD domain-containing protein [Spirochaetales bacterium]